MVQFHCSIPKVLKGVQAVHFVQEAVPVGTHPFTENKVLVLTAGKQINLDFLPQKRIFFNFVL